MGGMTEVGTVTATAGLTNENADDSPPEENLLYDYPGVRPARSCGGLDGGGVAGGPRRPRLPAGHQAVAFRRRMRERLRPQRPQADRPSPCGRPVRSYPCGCLLRPDAALTYHAGPTASQRMPTPVPSGRTGKREPGSSRPLALWHGQLTLLRSVSKLWCGRQVPKRPPNGSSVSPASSRSPPGPVSERRRLRGVRLPSVHTAIDSPVPTEAAVCETTRNGQEKDDDEARHEASAFGVSHCVSRVNVDAVCAQAPFKLSSGSARTASGDLPAVEPGKGARLIRAARHT